MKKELLVLLWMLVLGFGIQIGKCQTTCTNQVKITVKKTSNNETIDGRIEINGAHVEDANNCYTINNGDLIDVSRKNLDPSNLWYQSVSFRIQYIDPDVKELVFYLNNNELNVNSCTGTAFHKLLSGFFKYQDGTSSDLYLVYNTDVEESPYSNGFYSICLEGTNQVVYKHGDRELIKFLTFEPADSDTKVDVIIDDRCKTDGKARN